MKRPVRQTIPLTRAKKKAPSTRAFVAITAVEGLKLGKDSKQRLRNLQSDRSLTPDQRRAEVIKAYAPLAHKK